MFTWHSKPLLFVTGTYAEPYWAVLSTQSTAIKKHSYTYLYAVIISKLLACKQKYNIDIQLSLMPAIKVWL
jgi:hypothetical protein